MALITNNFTLYTITERPPQDGCYYLVRVPEYCDSEYVVAQWDKKSSEWISEGAGNDAALNECYTHYTLLPNSEE